MPVKVITDSACDLPQHLVDELDIAIVPLTVSFGSQEFVDRVDLTPAEFWARCSASPELPKTAAPAPAQFEQAFRDAAAAGYDAAVSINLSGGLSATLEAAQLAAQAVADVLPVRVIDSRQVSIALGLLVLEAARHAKAGKGVDDVAGAAEDGAKRTRLFATVDTLDNLRKGGRIGGAAALLGTMLSIKPVIELRDGIVEAESKQRTRSKSLRYLAERVAQHGRVENLAIIQAECPDLKEFLDLLAPLYPREEIVIGDVGAVIGAHAGPRAMGVSFQIPAS
jgi:DegV family protein with EDD domain